VDALETTSEWTQLLATIAPSSLLDEFSHDEARTRKLSLSAADLHIDYSKQLVNDEVMDRLVSWRERDKLVRHLNTWLRAI